MSDTSQSKRMIVITDDGKIDLVGKWKVGELLAAARALAGIANDVEIEALPTPAPAPVPAE